MKINNQVSYKQNFGMKYNPRVVKAIMEQKNIPLQARLEAVQNLRKMATDRIKLTSVNFLTRREYASNKHINAMGIILKVKENLIRRSTEVREIHFSNGNDRQNLLSYLRNTIRYVEYNRIDKKLERALRISDKKFQQTRQVLFKLYPHHRKYIEARTPDVLLPY